MKKLTFLSLVMLVLVFTANAQYFAGGSIAFSTDGGSIKTGTTQTDKTSHLSFELAPKGGYILSENFWVGAQLGFGFDRTKTPGATEIIDKTTMFGIMPFARYYALHFNKFALGVEGQLGLGFSNDKTESGGTTTDGPKTTALGLAVFPQIAYELNDRISLEAQLSGLNLGYSYAIQKNTVAGTDVKDVTSGFSAGANLENVFTTGFITFGVSIKL